MDRIVENHPRMWLQKTVDSYKDKKPIYMLPLLTDGAVSLGCVACGALIIPIGKNWDQNKSFSQHSPAPNRGQNKFFSSLTNTQAETIHKKWFLLQASKHTCMLYQLPIMHLELQVLTGFIAGQSQHLFCPGRSCSKVTRLLVAETLKFIS